MLPPLASPKRPSCPRSGSQDCLSHTHTRVRAQQQDPKAASLPRAWKSLGSRRRVKAPGWACLSESWPSTQWAHANGPPLPPPQVCARGQHQHTHRAAPPGPHRHVHPHAGTHMCACIPHEAHVHTQAPSTRGTGTHKGHLRRITGLQNRSESRAAYTCPVWARL